HRETYEIMRAEDVGWNTNKLVLGKHSGRAAVKARFEALGISFVDNDALNTAFVKFKDLADKKHEIFDEDLQALVSDTQAHTLVDVYELGEMEVVCKTGQSPRAKVEVKIRGKSVSADAIGSGPVDATFKAIESLVNSGSHLQLYSVNAITQGTDSLGDVTVRLEHDGQIVNGVGADTDIVTASAKAYLHALNLLSAHAAKAHPQHDGI
ncbi:MAG TPA: alpha-isopropylmalate synthase regulatory domain-containing protein, partial [Cellvibrio sp.]